MRNVFCGMLRLLLVVSAMLSVLSTVVVAQGHAVGCSYCGHPPQAPWHYRNCRLYNPPKKPEWQPDPGQGGRGMTPDESLNLMAPVMIPIYTGIGGVEGFYHGARWAWASTFHESSNYFRFISEQTIVGVLSRVPAIGWQFQFPKLVAWVTGSPFLVLYGIPYLAIKGVSALIPKPDPMTKAQAAAWKELTPALEQPLGIEDMYVDNEVSDSRIVLAKLQKDRPTVKLGQWNTSGTLKIHDVPVPRLADAGISLNQSSASRFKAIDSRAVRQRAAVQKLLGRFGSTIGGDLKDQAYDYLDTTLSRAGIAIRTGSVCRFRDELMDFVNPLVDYAKDNLQPTVRMLVHGPRTQREFELYQRHADFEAEMMKKVGGVK